MLTEIGPEIKGVLRILDKDYGVSVFAVSGAFDGSIRLTGVLTDPLPKGVELGEFTAWGHLTEKGSIRGVWETTIGTGGTFELFPHDEADSQPKRDSNDLPEQIYSKNIAVGSIRLHKSDVARLIEYLKNDFDSARVIVTCNLRESQLTRYSDDFLNDKSIHSSPLDYLKLQIQEPEAHGINRLVIVEINAKGVNEVRVQGIKESWVIGKSESVAAFLRQHQRSIVTNYKKFGLNINSFIFISTMVLVPSIDSVMDRALFVGVVFALLQFLLVIHAKFVPNACIMMEDVSTNIINRIWPTMLSWIVAVSSSLVAAFLFYWLVN